ncbi:type VI secretion-associated protein [Yersinia pseudotuberculosis]|uniref:type VI secretion system protein TssA n=1 Tax=Yersinia pseudotuberculosis TaxID=633 RepID=UPI0005DD201E|nr:type VI secretion system protein TssA [Yersinia pseudotuberculosis]MBO1550960.1 type VI secretion system protein TssA [Yersinia pseudotuberculosis]MBO1570963.1 type VI secretion system protein TssA [Yersinia pseudotuberculosis]MBO1585917.1 type VI secretion system protein TssA [Yersinia pseudotuberculosis]MBO1635312.1 type VI secretion system protein TssA [Yersinia pseudotuberculosis]CNE34185.1 ImpA domain-containing protein [Yersinia pseudotuberculosis]
MATLTTLLTACAAEPEPLLQQARQQVALWERWLQPVTPDKHTGEDPGYDDHFQQMREEVNKLSGADTTLTCELAEKLFTTHGKDVRVATYYVWARLHRDGEAGLADGLSLLAGLITRFGEGLHPLRATSRKTALEWLAGSRMRDSLSLYPEVDKADFERIVGALALIEQGLSLWDEGVRPQLGGLYTALENRLAQSGGLNAVVPQNSSGSSSAGSLNPANTASPALRPVQSGRDLLDQTKTLAKYLRNQPQGWLSGHHLIKSVRWDTVHQSPPLDVNGRTRLVPPRPEYRVQLKRLYLQQNWLALLEQAESIFAEGVNHFWLDVQWYLHQALSKAGAPFDGWASCITQDLRLLLTRLPGLEGLCWSDGTPFADEVTLGWINQQVLESVSGWGSEPAAVSSGEDGILLLEPEALAQADSEGIEAALNWLQSRPGITTARHQWLLRLVMARVAEQYGKNDMALHLLSGLDSSGALLTLPQWEPGLVFEVKARRLKLLRMKAQRGDSDKTRLHAEMESLLSGLIALDPARAAVLCG